MSHDTASAMEMKMTEPKLPAERDEKMPWTTPVLERAGTIHDVKGGAVQGLDSNNLPAAIS